MSRRIARENIYKLVFEYLFYDSFNQTSLELMLLDSNLTEDDKKYVINVYEGVAAKKDELLALIEKHAKGFRIDRIFRPDLSALLIATYELKYLDDVPPAVAISEAVELVKKYSTDKSYSFVNGVLAGVYKEIKGE
ncbi:MAG: transcription antitermination factor NusB [Clostridia bacterium]|nr:transcription antitermination factor NusB [Clostridia bacterium]MDY5264764.1 transcription antitermination factor NusB [Eubacteriales bacterium]MDY5439776.1 transcription antitermination factor NusB [Eubacteriales bacterium]